jgi:predicted DNA-binding protein
MASTTATIRVPAETRDRLAAVASQRGVSVAGLLSEIALREHLHQVYAAERESWSKVLEDPEFAAELQEWDEADLYA